MPLVNFFKLLKMSSLWGSIFARSKFGQNPFARSSTETIASVWRRWMRRLLFFSGASLTASVAYVGATCIEDVPVSGRKRLLLTTREEEIELGKASSEQMVDEFQKQGKLLLVHDIDGRKPPPPPFSHSKWRRWRRWAHNLTKEKLEEWLATKQGRQWWASSPEAQLVINAAYRIVGAAKASTDLPEGIEKLTWRLHVVYDPNVPNAFVVPNGHIFVFTGILPSCPSEDTLGFLLGHEAAHACLRHTGETLSEAPFLEMLSVVVTSALLSLLPVDAFFSSSFVEGLLVKSTLLGLDTALVDAAFSKRYSRDHETEADEVGVLLAARACYDPHDAQHLMHNFAMMEGVNTYDQGVRTMREQRSLVGSMLAMLRTHPDPDQREAKLAEQQRFAMSERVRCDCAPIDLTRRKQLDAALKKRDAEERKVKRKKSVACSQRHEH